MKKTAIMLFGTLVLVSTFFTACKKEKKDEEKPPHEVNSKDSKKNGQKAGELVCKSQEIRAEIDVLIEAKDALDWQNKEERKEIAKMMNKIFKLELKQQELFLARAKLYNKSWSQINNPKDRERWLEEFNEYAEGYVEDNCKYNQARNY